MTFRPRFFGLTFGPRFYNSNSYQQTLLKKENGGCTSHLLVQNFDAVLVVIVISEGDTMSAKFYRKRLKHVRPHISRYAICSFPQGTFALRSAIDNEGPRPGPIRGHAGARGGGGMSHYPQFAHDLFTSCSLFAHSMLTICSLFAYDLQTIC